MQRYKVFLISPNFIVKNCFFLTLHLVCVCLPYHVHAYVVAVVWNIFQYLEVEAQPDLICQC